MTIDSRIETDDYCCEAARDRAEVERRINLGWSDSRLMAWAIGRGLKGGVRDGFVSFINSRIAWVLVSLALALHAARLLIEALR